MTAQPSKLQQAAGHPMEGTYFETKNGHLALHQPFILTSASNDSRTRGDI
jgi:hypothetical protein